MHTAPQAPQLEVSPLVSTHEAPQVVLPPQSAVHAPLWQTEPFGQALPHAPQLPESDVSSTHWPLQAA
jgi:hypothetical protein